MPLFDNIEVLAPIATRFAESGGLTPAERAELLRIAQGLGCKDSATAANVSPETVRARRKRIYRRLDATGANDIIARLLGATLGALSAGQVAERRDEQQRPSAAL